MSNNINEKTFTLVINTVREFTLRMTNFAATLSLRWLLNFSLGMIFVAKIRQKKTLALRLGNIRNTYVAKMLKRTSTVMSAGIVNIVYAIKILNRVTTHIYITVPITFVLETLQRKLVNISAGSIGLAFSVIVANLIKLSFHDPLTLAVCDVKTLAQMDYV